MQRFSFPTHYFTQLMPYFCLQADFSSLKEVSRFASEVSQRCQRLDVLINNAGDSQQCEIWLHLLTRKFLGFQVCFLIRWK